MRLLLLIGIVVLHVASFSDAKKTKTVIFLDDDQEDPILKANYSEDPLLREYALNAVTHGANVFSGKFVKEVGKIIRGNFICSPISASTLLSIITYGARGQTESQLRDVLEIPKSHDIAQIGFQTLVDSFADYEQVQLRLANGIFLPFGFRPKSEFMEMTVRAFRSDAPNLDFHNSVESSRIINEWCEEKTNKRIKNIVTPDDFDRHTALVLVNAVYFKGDWVTKFAFTSLRNFYVNGIEEKRIPTMFSQDSYRYGVLSDADAHFVEIPYKSEDSRHNISMFVILPLKMNGIAHLEENFDKVNVKELIRLGKKSNVMLFLPKFKIESEIALQGPLEGMGLTNMFKNPDFRGIVNYPRLEITKIVQKAFIEIDEVGSEASAATAAAIANKSLGKIDPTIVRFLANHPFIAIIATTSNNPVNLFTIRYNGA